MNLLFGEFPILLGISDIGIVGRLEADERDVGSVTERAELVDVEQALARALLLARREIAESSGGVPVLLLTGQLCQEHL